MSERGTPLAILFKAPAQQPADGNRRVMRQDTVTLDALLETRARLFQELPAALDTNERQFLRTLARAEPD